MKLSEEQQRFARHIADLIYHAYARGYALTFGHAYRCQDCPVGIDASLHKRRLAFDFNLFKDGKYLTDTEDWRELGRYWEALDPHNRSGVRFNDGNHLERVPGGWRDGTEEAL